MTAAWQAIDIQDAGYDAGAAFGQLYSLDICLDMCLPARMVVHFSTNTCPIGVDPEIAKEKIILQLSLDGTDCKESCIVPV